MLGLDLDFQQFHLFVLLKWEFCQNPPLISAQKTTEFKNFRIKPAVNLNSY